MKSSPHRAIFDRPRRRGNPVIGAQVGTIPGASGAGSPTQANQTASGSGTHTNQSISALAWDTIANAGEHGTPSPTTAVTVGQRLLIGSNYRTGGAGPTTQPPLSPSTATLAASSTIAAVAGYDTAGSSRGSAGIWLRQVTGAGNVTVDVATDRASSAQYVDWLLVLTGYTTVVQSARSTADATDAVSLSLASTPSGLVVMAVQYGGAGGTGGRMTGAPSGWTSLAHFGRDGNVIALHVQLFTRSGAGAQSVSFNMGGSPSGDAVISGGRDVVMMELA